MQQEEHVANELNTFSGSAQKAETDSDENLNGEDEEDDEYDESDSDVKYGITGEFSSLALCLVRFV